MPTDRDVNVLMKKSQDNYNNTMYPITKIENILMDSKNHTLDKWIKERVQWTEDVDEVFTKLKDVEPGAQVNVPAFSRVRVNGKHIAASLKKDTLDIVAGDNSQVQIINDELVISSTGATPETVGFATENSAGVISAETFKKIQGIENNANKYTHPKSGITAGQYVAVNVDDYGHVTAGINKPLPVALGGTGLTSLDALKDLIVASGDLNTIDTPVENSELAITSGGVFKALLEKADKNHGIHLPELTGTKTKFLRDDNNWVELPRASKESEGIVKLANEDNLTDENLAVTPKLLTDRINKIIGNATTYTSLKSIEDWITGQGEAGGFGTSLENYLKDSKAYTDNKISELIGGADSSFDTLKEIQNWISEHSDVYKALVQSIADNKTYADKRYSALLNGATTYTNLKLVENWICNVGAMKVDRVDGKGLSTNDLTNELKANYDEAYDHAKSLHAPTDAERNSIVSISRNGMELKPDRFRNVDIVVPIKTSQLINDNKFISEHPEVKSEEDTSTEQKITSGGTFTVIDAINRDKFNHVVSINTKQIKLPKFVEGDVEYEPFTLSIEDKNTSYPEVYRPSERKDIRLIFNNLLKISKEDNKVTINVDLNNASEKESGLLSPELLAKINGIEDDANRYELPIAGENLGGVKTISKVEKPDDYTPSPIIDGIVYHKEYGSDRGISILNGKFGHMNKIGEGTISESKGDRVLAFGDSFEIPVIKYDDYGHIIGSEKTILNLPTTDVAGSTKNTLNETQKAYILGSVSPKTNTNNPVFDTGVYLGENAGELFAKKFFGDLIGIAEKAVSDRDGNIITDTYAKQSDVSFVCGTLKPDAPRYGHTLWAEITD